MSDMPVSPSCAESKDLAKQKGLASQACYTEHFENMADSIMTEFHFCRFSQPTLDSLVLSAVLLWLTTVVVTSMIVKLTLVDSEKANGEAFFHATFRREQNRLSLVTFNTLRHVKRFPCSHHVLG